MLYFEHSWRKWGEKLRHSKSQSIIALTIIAGVIYRIEVLAQGMRSPGNKAMTARMADFSVRSTTAVSQATTNLIFDKKHN